MFSFLRDLLDVLCVKYREDDLYVCAEAVILTANTPLVAAEANILLADTLLVAAEAGLLDQRVFIQVKGSIN